jgi:hypothetical protein
MPSGDPLVTRELKALQDDVSTAQRQRYSRREAASAVNPDAPTREAISVTSNDDAEHAADAQKLREQFREFIDEATAFFEEAEKNIASHPTASVLGALLIGILIGRLAGRS